MLRTVGSCLRRLLALAGNPQDINAFMDRMGLSGAGAFGAPAAPGGGAPPVADPEAAYASQLEQLQVCVSWTLSELDGAVTADAWRPPNYIAHQELQRRPQNFMMEVVCAMTPSSAAEPFSV